jgi:phosphate transport system protein
MTHLDTEIHQLREEIIELHRMVRTQLVKCKTALLSFDRDLAKEVVATEKRINALELKIDRDCENMLALFNPVAVDLRFILAVLKINNNLERIGDHAEGIARYVLDLDKPFDSELAVRYRVEEGFEVAVSMIDDSLSALLNEDTALARKVFMKDEALDHINKNATNVTIDLITKNAPDPLHYVNTLSIIRKLERVGDQTKNIAEEIIFFIEAKVLKHGKKS